MQEVRMTFGEHLEELRKRILFCLLYLVIGVALAMIYEKDLMKIALGPHKRAYSSAQKTRLLERYRRILDGIEPLQTLTPQAATLDGRALVVGRIRWEILYAADVELREAAEGLTAPFETFAENVDTMLPSVPEGERSRLKEAMRKLGDGVSLGIIAKFAPQEAVEATADIPRNLKRLEEEFRDFAVKHSTGGLRELISWGDELDELTERFGALNKFIDDRRQQVLESDITLEQIHESTTETGIGAALMDVHKRLSGILTDMKSAHRAEIMVISYLEQFYTHLKVAIIFGLLFTVPFILYEMWKFVGAGLYIHEQRYVVTFLPFSLGLFAVGTYFGYEILIPVALTFLAGWGDANIDLAFTLGNYITLFFTLTLVLGLVFQTPLIMVFLTKINLVDVSGFRRFRRPAMMCGVVLAAILTPPDPISLLLMAGPMILLYEFGILVCQFLTPKTNKEVTA